MKRRGLFGLLGSALVPWIGAKPAGAASTTADPKWQLSPGQWRARLSPEAFSVLRQAGTERPFTSPLNKEKRQGTYGCAGCQLPLFSSQAKYDSGTGWPSFYEALPDGIATKVDFKLVIPRTEYHCRRCGGHQGHVFDDGPRPTGKRYCNNGVALVFQAKAN
jgi:peptide-methionine (R)-S-oxide reductase